MIKWVWAVIDRPLDRFDVAATFWTAVTGTTLSRAAEADGRQTILTPPAGNPCLKLNGVDTVGGAHMDLAVAQVGQTVTQACGLGATVIDETVARSVLLSPNGQPFCLVMWRGEADRPAVVRSGLATSRLDQVCIDVAPSAYDSELGFWAALTGWEFHRGASPQRDLLKPAASLPIRILLQRLDSDRSTSAHLDLACSDIDAIRAWHEEWGARLVRRWHRWLVMRDPAGGTYCLTIRDPQTGALPQWAC